MLENLVLGALFFLLVPGVLLTLPQGGSKFTVAFVHAIVFVLAYTVLQYLADYGGYDYAVYDDEEGFGPGGRSTVCTRPYNCGSRNNAGLAMCSCRNKSGKHLVYR
jgi:hypothetical protein